MGTNFYFMCTDKKLVRDNFAVNEEWGVHNEESEADLFTLFAHIKYFETEKVAIKGKEKYQSIRKLKVLSELYNPALFAVSDEVSLLDYHYSK